MANREKPSAAMLELFRVFSSFFTAVGRKKGIEFKPCATDWIISTASKSGTTWVQQICHGLRSGGDMDFEEIGLVSPCLEMAHDAGYKNLQAPQPYTPRMYKTHLWYPDCPKRAGKYIIVIRRPCDAAVSGFYFLQNWSFKEGEISLEEYIEWIFLAADRPKDWTENASQFDHILSWYPHRLDDNVLWLHYEDLQQDLRGCVRLIAEFLQCGHQDEQLQDLVARQASFSFMKKHSGKFDEHVLKNARNEAAGLAPDAGFSSNCGKVRNGGKVSARSVLSETVIDKIQQKWTESITAITGHETYDAFRESINKELERHFIE